MNKKLLFMIFYIFAFIIVIFLIIKIAVKNNSKVNEKTELIQIANSEEKSNGEVTDECIDEWNDYINSKVEEASTNNAEDKTRYLLKNVDGFIDVYYVDNNGEYLYKKTNIAIEYLSKEDLDKLNNGIEVIGIEELNKKLEDFE